MLRPRKICMELESSFTCNENKRDLAGKQHKTEEKLHHCEDIVSSKLFLFVCFSENECVASSDPTKPRGASQVHRADCLPLIRFCKVCTSFLSGCHFYCEYLQSAMPR